MTDSHKKIKQALQQVEETKKIMEDNVEKLILRAELLKKLDTKTKDLRNHTQEFALSSHELKVELQTKNYILGAGLFLGILGALYGILSGYSPASALFVGMFGATIGGALGHYFGQIKGFFEKLWFAYQLQDSPLKAIGNKLRGLYTAKLKSAPHASLSSRLDTEKEKTFINHHEQATQPLEISKTLTQWFESKKQDKTQAAPTVKNKTSVEQARNRF
jgi:xanthosine utilization system XapX-like protein